MPGKGNKRKLFGSPPPTPSKPGIAVKHVSENYATLPPNLLDVKFGHIFFLWISFEKSITNVEKQLNLILEESTQASYHYSITKVINDLLRFKRLTNDGQFLTFKDECKSSFELITGTPKRVKSVTSPLLLLAHHPPSTPVKSVSVSCNNSPVKTRKICNNCQLLKKSLRKCLNDKNKLSNHFKRKKKPRKYIRKCVVQSYTEDVETVSSKKTGRKNYSHLPPKRLRETLHRRDETIENQTLEIKKNNNLITELQLHLKNRDLAKMKDININKIVTSTAEKENKIENRLCELVAEKKKYVQELGAIETEYQHQILILEETIHELKQNKEQAVVLRKEGKMFGVDMRLTVFDCIDANVPTSRIPSLIGSFSKRLGADVKDIPSRSTVETMAVELGVLSDFQAAEFLYQTQNATVAFDATTQEGLHVNEIHLTSKERTVVLALDQLAGGLATDYADHVVKTVEHLARTYVSIQTKVDQGQEALSVNDVNKTMQSHIKCTLTDRAAANHAAIRIVNEEFGSTLVEMNCHLHPLDTIATKCKTALKSLESTSFKSKLFTGTCRAERVILAMNKMRFKDSKGDPHGFRVFLSDHNLPLSLITRYRGNRLHILFKLSATYIQYHQELKLYLEKKCLHTSDLKTGLIEEFSSTETISQLQVLGVFGKVLTGPWMKSFYRNTETQLQHIEAFEKIKLCYQRMETCAAKDQISIDFTSDFFGNPIVNKADDKLWYTSDPEGFSAMFKAVLEAALGVIKKQFQNYFNMTINTDLRELTSSTRTHNMDAEEVMGMFSAAIARAPRATMLFISSKIRSKKNRTVKYLLSHPKAEIIVKAGVREARQLKRRAQICASDLQKELSTRVEIKMQKKEDTGRKKIEKKVKEIVANSTGRVQAFMEVFPDIDNCSLDVVLDIVDGSVVKRAIVHDWVDEDDDGRMKTVSFNGKIEKLKNGIYTVCYWGAEQRYDTDGEDTKLSVDQMIVDFVFGELKFI